MLALLQLLLHCKRALSSGSFRLSNVFGSEMVLQRAPQQAMVWGFGSAGQVVRTIFGGETLQTTVGADSIWRQKLPATPAGGPHDLRFSSGGDGGEIVLSDVLFGDTYLCGGQSNMAVTVDFVFNASAEIAAADAFPDIRLFTVGFYNQLPAHKDSPQVELTGRIEQNWTKASSKSVSLAWKQDPAGIWGAFSAVCWFFGRDLYQSLNGSVPIGLISSAIGGTAIQSWTAPEAQKGCPKGNGDIVGSLWNINIHPYTVGPMAITGFQWFQGEADADANRTYGYMVLVEVTIEHHTSNSNRSKGEREEGDEDQVVWTEVWGSRMVQMLTTLGWGGWGGGKALPHFAIALSHDAIWVPFFGSFSFTGRCARDADCAFPALITDWRRQFGRLDTTPPAYFAGVMLAAYINDSNIPWQPIAPLRDCQLSALSLPHTALVSATDLGDPLSPKGSVHSRNKAPLGRRLADAALRVVYGKEEVQCMGPLYASARALPRAAGGAGAGAEAGAGAGAGGVEVEVSFVPESIAAGLELLAHARCPTEEGVPLSECSWFGVQTADGVWHNATASLTEDRRRLVLSTGSSAAVGHSQQQRSTTAIATRFGFSAWPVTALYSAGLPAYPWNKRI